MQDFLLQILLFLVSVVIGITIPLLRPAYQKWIAGLLSAIAFAISSFLFGYDLGTRRCPPIPVLPKESVTKEYFYSEDFSRVPKGTIPANWLGGEALAVVPSSSGNELTNFEIRSNLYIETEKILFPPDYDLEIVLWWDYGGLRVQLGKLTIDMIADVANTTAADGYIQIENSKIPLKKRLNNKPLALLIQKRGNVFSFHIDNKDINKEIFVGRYDDIDANSIAFTNRDVPNRTRHFGIQRILGKLVQSQQIK